MGSSSEDHEHLYKISLQSIKKVLRYFGINQRRDLKFLELSFKKSERNERKVRKMGKGSLGGVQKSCEADLVSTLYSDDLQQSPSTE